ncbi:MAG: hypothetical protein CMD78_01750 [Gammaproteobacteria bacterium]|nr:hypothetical protein [Gammaproteobacteria bacterium]
MPQSFEDIKYDRERAAKWLLVVAWLVEICAASIGFYFAFIIAEGTEEFLRPFESVLFGSVESNIRLAMLPFIIVGLVELTKIPLAYAAYHSRVTGWRVAFFTTLTLLCVLTAETVFTGMERSLNNQMSFFAEEKKGQERLKNEIANTEKNIAEINEDTLEDLESSYNAFITKNNQLMTGELEVIDQNRKDRMNPILEAKSAATTQFTNPKNTQLSDLQEQRSEARKNLPKQIDQANNNIDAIKSDFRFLIDSQQQRINSANNEISRLNVQEANEGRLFGAGNYTSKREEQAEQIKDALSLIEKYRAEQALVIANTEAEDKEERERTENLITELSGEIEAISIVSKQVYDEQQKAFDETIESIDKFAEQERSIVMSKYNSQKSLNTESYEKERSIIQGRRQGLGALEAKLIKDRLSLISTEKTINDKSEQIQVMRFAKSWGNRNDLAEVENSDITAVMILWFGTISLIAAITGTIIAFASFILKDKDAFTPKTKSKRLINSFRQLLIARRNYYEKKKFYKQTKEPSRLAKLVDAIIERLLRPVIKEVVRKEIVHVPDFNLEKIKERTSSKKSPPKKNKRE